MAHLDDVCDKHVWFTRQGTRVSAHSPCNRFPPCSCRNPAPNHAPLCCSPYRLVPLAAAATAQSWRAWQSCATSEWVVGCGGGRVCRQHQGVADLHAIACNLPCHMHVMA